MSPPIHDRNYSPDTSSQISVSERFATRNADLSHIVAGGFFEDFGQNHAVPTGKSVFGIAPSAA